MNKIIFVCLFLLSINFSNAQSVKVYKGTDKQGTPLCVYSSNNVDKVVFGEDCPNEIPDNVVDLGVVVNHKRIYFAKSNLKATGLAEKETDFGDYFAWAETEPYLTSFDYSYKRVSQNLTCEFTNLVWKRGYSSGYTEKNNSLYRTKYNLKDSKLEDEDDAAHAILGEGWRMPTYHEICILMSKDYTWEYTTLNGIYGAKVYKTSDGSKTNNYLFFPAAGEIVGTTFQYAISEGCYWTNTVHDGNQLWANLLNIGQSNLARNVAQSNAYNRYYGLQIRPVYVVSE